MCFVVSTGSLIYEQVNAPIWIFWSESFGITAVEATKYSPDFLIEDDDRDFSCNDRVLSWIPCVLIVIQWNRTDVSVPHFGHEVAVKSVFSLRTCELLSAAERQKRSRHQHKLQNSTNYVSVQHNACL